jgi:phosphoribosylaminoimidazole-succinocarboxamide synthase
VDAVDVIRPAQQQGSFDYSAYARRPEQALLPLEVIFRLGLPEGSSFRQRAAQDRGVLEDAGLTEIPSESTKFSSPVIEFSTKLEPTDRPLRHREAQDLAGLSEREFKKLINLTSLIALRLKSVVEAFGAELWDGKLEFAFTPGINHERDFRLVDSIGPDELRILRSGIHLSKESLRQVYRGSEWYRASLVAKEVAACENSLDWKSICRDRLGQVPLPLTPDQRSVATQLYPALAEAFTAAVKGERLKAEVALDAVVEGLRKVRSP